MTSNTTPVHTTRRDPAAVLAASTFSAGVNLLPHDLRGDACRLYYMLRTIDDLVDEHDPRAPNRVQAIEAWAHGQKIETTPETSTLIHLARRYPISHQALIEFCHGMRHDLTNKKINTENDLERYCQYVGGTVGILLTALFGASHPDTVTNMATLGRAMQRTNILRDIDEDHAHGRLYIPRTTIEQYGFPHPTERQALLEDQIAHTNQLYDEGSPAISHLRRGARAMALSTTLYRRILRQIERDNHGNEFKAIALTPARKYQPSQPTAPIIRASDHAHHLDTHSLRHVTQ